MLTFYDNIIFTQSQISTTLTKMSDLSLLWKLRGTLITETRRPQSSKPELRWILCIIRDKRFITNSTGPASAVNNHIYHNTLPLYSHCFHSGYKQGQPGGLIAAWNTRVAFKLVYRPGCKTKDADSMTIDRILRKNYLVTSSPLWIWSVSNFSSGIFNHWRNTKKEIILNSVTIILLNLLLTKYYVIIRNLK